MDKAIENLQINEFNNRKIVISTNRVHPFVSNSLGCICHLVSPGLHQRLVRPSTISTFAIKGYDEEDSYMKKFYESCVNLKIRSLILSSNKVK